MPTTHTALSITPPVDNDHVAPGAIPFTRAEVVANDPVVRAMLEALEEAQRFLDYFAKHRTTFVGDGTPLGALVEVEKAIERAKAAGIGA